MASKDQLREIHNIVAKLKKSGPVWQAKEEANGERILVSNSDNYQVNFEHLFDGDSGWPHRFTEYKMVLRIGEVGGDYGGVFYSTFSSRYTEEYHTYKNLLAYFEAEYSAAMGRKRKEWSDRAEAEKQAQESALKRFLK